MAMFFILFACYFFSSAQALSHLEPRAVCDKSDLKLLTQRIVQPESFCRYYVSSYRKQSPLKELSSTRLDSLCRCRYPRLAKAPLQSIPPLSNKSGKLAASQCSKAYLKKVAAQYRDARQFCNYFTAVDRSQEPGQAVPGLRNTRAVQEACACLPGDSAPAQMTQSSASIVTSTTVTSTMATTTMITSTTTSISTSPVATNTRTPASASVSSHGLTFTQYYAGRWYVQKASNTQSTLLDATLDPAAAVQACADFSSQLRSAPSSFQVYLFRPSVVRVDGWYCDSFPNINRDPSLFNVRNEGAVDVYGYAAGSAATFSSTTASITPSSLPTKA